MTLPRVTVLATGGTVAGSAASSLDPTGYAAATTPVNELLAALPSLAAVADLTAEQFSQIDSADLTDAMLIALAERVAAIQADPDVDAVVITHGTDTLEESAYFLHLLLTSAKPVVLVGALRPPTALSADGPRNLFAAVTVAAAPDAAGRGVLVVMNDEIHSARDVTKTSTVSVGSFASPWGPLGVVAGGRATFARSVARPHTGQTQFGIPGELPTSAVLFAHPGLNDRAVEAVADSDVIVFAGYGNATVPARIVDALEWARSTGALVVRASRVAGVVTRVGASGAVVNGWVAVDDQNPQRARLLACLAITVTHDEAEIQRMFHRY